MKEVAINAAVTAIGGESDLEKGLQKAIDAKKMNFWGLFEKVGGYDLPNSSNFLFINGSQLKSISFKNI